MSISALHSPEKTTGYPHDVAPEVTSIGHHVKVSLYRNSSMEIERRDKKLDKNAVFW